MTSADLAAIIVPVVVVAVLAVWIAAVMRADKHPGHRHPGQQPRRTLTGGSFRASGGRQVTPRPDAEPTEPSPVRYESPPRSRSDV